MPLLGVLPHDCKQRGKPVFFKKRHCIGFVEIISVVKGQHNAFFGQSNTVFETVDDDGSAENTITVFFQKFKVAFKTAGANNVDRRFVVVGHGVVIHNNRQIFRAFLRCVDF